MPQLELGHILDRINPQSHGGAEDYNARELLIDIYVCPSAERPSGAYKESHYVGVAGSANTTSTIDLEDKNCGDIDANGVFYPESNTRLSQITDGSSNTLAIGERLYLFRHWLFGVTWKGNPKSKICTGGSKNLHYPLNADQSVYGYYAFDPLAPPGAMKTVLLNELQFASEHPGGVQFSYADGSVHFLVDSIDFTLLKERASRYSNELAEE